MGEGAREKIKEKMAKIGPKKERIVVFGALALIAAIVYSVFFIYNKHENKTHLKVSGNIDGNDVRISFRVNGQIEELLVDEGYVVKKGDIVARLKKDELGRLLEQAEASLKLGVAQYELDQLDHIRSENLFREGAISAQQRDTAKTKADTDKANVDQLAAARDLAETKLGWADLASPLNGYIITKSALQGEVVQPGAPVFTAVDLNDIWVSAYIEEKDLGRVKLGQKAVVKIDTFPGRKYDGTVSFISSQTEFTPKYIQTTEERVKYVYRIKVKTDNASLDLKPGMPADAFIITE